MQLHQPHADLFVPDGTPVDQAAARTTHLGIGAHQDDLEFMAFHGILTCHARHDLWFGGVTCTNGGGCARSGRYAACTDAEMAAVRRQEQRTAAVIGRYGIMIQLDHPSHAVRSRAATDLRDDLKEVLSATRPDVVYTHNPADKHDTHIGVVVSVLQALRELPRAQRPGQVIGCEVWRDLDWLPDGEKVVMDVSGYDHLAAALNGVFDSQIAGGKRYDLAALGRRSANATFFESHATDKTSQIIFGLDLTPLVTDESRDIVAYTCACIERFAADARERLERRLEPH